MYQSESVTVTRDCDAIMIPVGTPVTIPKGSVVFITQALGDTFTVNVNGNLVRIAGKDGDALGKEPIEARLTETDDDSGEVNEAQVWELLKTCFDPEIPVNIVDLGLIYGVEIKPLENQTTQFKIDVQMTLTAPGCGMGDILANDVRMKLLMIPNVADVHVDLVFEPLWNQSMMSEAAKLQLGML